MKKTGFLCALSATLAFLSFGGAFSAPLNPTPNRESQSLYSFEGQDLDGWISDPMATGANALASLNTDPQFVSDGQGSAKLDLTDVGGGIGNVFAIDLPDPADFTDYHALSLDVYAPDSSLFPDQPGGWFQLLPRITSASGGISYLGNRDMHAGWNHMMWDLEETKKEGISRIQIDGNTDGARPWSGPIYVDNVRLWKDPMAGIHSDETPILGFDTQSEIDLFSADTAHPASLNADAQYLHDGAGSMAIDLTGVTGWNAFDQTNGLPGVDLSKATAIHLDVFVPNGNQPSDWSQLGFEITGGGGYLQTETMGFIPDQWNTIELALSPEDAAKLTNVTEFGLHTNGGQPWNGPIYVDNLRAVIPSGGGTTAKLGDLNGDAAVNVQDATLSLRLAIGLLTDPTDAQKTAGDVNEDGKWNIQDTTLILQVAVGLKPGF
jgi:hypothetical protein